jgi:hypothetical protein
VAEPENYRPPRERVGGVRTIVANRPLRSALLAYGAIYASQYASWVAMLVYAFSRGGASTAGVVAVVQLVPAILIAPLASSSADRRGPGFMLVAGYSIQTGALLCAAAAVAAGIPLGAYVAAAVATTAGATTRPAQAALLPALVRTTEELTAANAFEGWAGGVSIVVASAGTGVLLGITDVAVVFLLGGLLALGASALVWDTRRIRPLAVDDESRSARAAHLLAGVRLIATERTPRLLVSLLTAGSCVIGALDILFVVLAIDVLHRGQAWVGYLNLAYGLGAVATAGACASLLGRRRLLPAIACGAAASSAAIAACAIGGLGALGIAGLLAVAGGGRVLLDVATRSLLQRVVPAQVLGRVFGAVEGLAMAALAVGSLLTPLLVSAGGSTMALIGVGAILPLVFAVSGRGVLAIDRAAHVPVVEIALLRSLGAFAALPAPALEGLAAALSPLAVQSGQTLIRQGDEGDRCYAIVEGQLDVTLDGRYVRTVTRGDLVGEIALLRYVPRTASVTAATDCAVLVLTREAFLTAVVGHAPTHAIANQATDARLDELARIADDG